MNFSLKDFAFISDVGLQRSQNEDQWLLDTTLSLAAIFDGMGGHDGGEIASLLAKEYCENMGQEYPLSDMLLEADRYIASHQSEGSARPMGTTAVALRWDPSGASYAWAGDSRLYALAKGQSIDLLSEDHTVAMRRAKRGEIKAHLAKKEPDGHMLTSCLGLFGQGFEQAFVEKGYYTFAKPTRFLLCSDGLTDLIADEELESNLNFKKTAPDCAKRLIELGLERGASDNISFIILDFY